MPTRTEHTTATFRHPFSPKGHEGPRPAGAHAAEPREELPQSRPFVAHRRVSATITQETARTGAVVQAISVDPRDLADAQPADRP
jgi:hypothetical protein